MKKIGKVLSMVLLVACFALLTSCANELLDLLPSNTTNIQSNLNESRMQVKIDYGFIREGKATSLLDSCTTDFLEKDAWELDEFLPGDIYVLTYQGEMMVLETYPGTLVLPEGGLLDVTRIDAGVLCLAYRDDKWQGAEQDVIFTQDICEYVVLDQEGNFCTLAEYDTTKPLYVSYSVGQIRYDTSKGTLIITPLAAYAYAPRETKQHAFYVNLDYGSYRAEKATVLMDSAVPFIEQTLIAGDIVYVSYTGDWLMEESYPENVVFVDGEIKRVDIYPARVCALRVAKDADGNKILVDQSGNSVQNAGYYVLTDADGSFTTWNLLEFGTTIYASYTANQGNAPTEIAGLYTYLPR